MNTRNRTRIALLAIAVPLCLQSTVGIADTNTQTAMAACVKAFVSTAVPPARQIALRTEAPSSSALLMRTRPAAIALTATEQRSGRRLAQATCRTDRNGVVIALNDRPLANAAPKAVLSAE